MHSLANDGSEGYTSVAVCFGEVSFLGHWNNEWRFPLVREITTIQSIIAELENNVIEINTLHYFRGYSILPKGFPFLNLFPDFLSHHVTEPWRQGSVVTEPPISFTARNATPQFRLKIGNFEHAVASSGLRRSNRESRPNFEKPRRCSLTNVMTPDGLTEAFAILAGVLQGDTLAPGTIHLHHRSGLCHENSSERPGRTWLYPKTQAKQAAPCKETIRCWVCRWCQMWP